MYEAGVLFLAGMKTNQLLAATEPTLHKRDVLWKGIMEDLFADFLRFFFADADRVFDIDRGFEFLEKELHEISPHTKTGHPRYVDKLVKVWYKDGTEKWLLVHIEVQGYTDKNFPARMFTYFYRICDKFQQEITSLVIFTDADRHYLPDRYEYDCFGTSLVFRYNTYKVIAQDEAVLKQSDNPFATIVLTVLTTLRQKGGDKEQLLQSFLQLVRRLYEKAFSREKIVRILLFIRQYVDFGDSGLLHKFEEEIHVITKEPDHMGIIEQVLQMETEAAEERGVLKSRIEIAKSLLSDTDHSIQTIAAFTRLSVDFLIEIKSGLSSERNMY